MVTLDAFLSQRNAQDIANIIQQFYQESEGRNFFQLLISRGDEERELWVRPHMSEAPFRLANGDQIIRCESNDGFAVDIVVPAREREYQPATVVVASHSGAH